MEKKEVRYRVEMTEKQLNLIRKSLEFRFRIMMGQERDLCDDMAFIGQENIDYESEEGKKAFDRCIQRRDHLLEVARAFFKIAYEPYGYQLVKTKEQLCLIDMWDQIRAVLGQSRWGSSFLHEGDEPVMKIERVVENDRNT